MSKVCKAAGIVGFKTNHSLIATAATRLYQSGVDEQLIMEKTGHRSLEGVCSYKRTSTEQREALSDIMNRKVPIIDSQTPLAIARQVSSYDSEVVNKFPGNEQVSTFALGSSTYYKHSNQMAYQATWFSTPALQSPSTFTIKTRVLGMHIHPAHTFYDFSSFSCFSSDVD